MRAVVQQPPDGPGLHAGPVRAPLRLIGALAGLLGSVAAFAGDLLPPELRACPEVAYPAGEDRGAQRVELLLTLGADGSVGDVEPVAGDEPFASLAMEAARACTFSPAREEGAPVEVQVPFTWQFPEPPVRMQGRVRARGTGAPVAGLRLAVGDRVVTTDLEGRWFVRALPDGEHEVRILDPALTARPVVVALTPGEVVEVALWVLEDRRDDEVVGTYDALGLHTERRQLDPDEVRATPGSLGDPIRALHSRPGLARTPFDAGWLLVRGGDNDDTGVFLDGVPFPLLFHLGGFTSVLHPEMTQTVRFWPGLAPARYATLSGAVDVIPRAIGDRPRVVAGVNTVFAHAFAEVPLGSKAGLAVAARRSYLDGVLALVLDPASARIAPRFWDAQAHARIGRTEVLAIGLSDALDAPGIDGDVVTVRQEGAQVQSRTELPLGDGSLVVAPSVAIHARSLFDELEEQRIVEQIPALRVEARTAPTARVRGTAGLDARQTTFVLTQGPDRRAAPTLSAAPYASAAAGDALSLDFGLRLDTLVVQDQLPRAGWSPRATGRWRLHEHVTLSGELGRTHQSPLSTLMIGVPEGATLNLERSDSVAAGAEVATGRFAATLGAYQRLIRGVAGIELDGSIGPQDGTARGVEATARWATARVDVSVLYQVGRSELREAADEPARPMFLDQTHRFEALALTELPRSWTLSGRFRYTSGFPRRPGEPPTPWEAYDLLNQQTVDLGLADDDLRLPPFYALDVKVARTWTFRRWELDAWLDAQNLTNRRVVEPLISGFVESEPSYGFGLPILPIFGLEGRFWPGHEPGAAAGPISPPSASGG